MPSPPEQLAVKEEQDDPSLDDPSLDDPTLDDPSLDDPSLDEQDDTPELHLIPPTIHTMVGLRGLQLHKRLLESIRECYDDPNDDVNDTTDVPDELEDRNLLFRMIALFVYPIVMSRTPAPEAILSASEASDSVSTKKMASESAPATTAHKKPRPPKRKKKK